MKVPISEVSIGPRHRKDMGELETLADSIQGQGLLQPIGITEDKELVFGERRLRVCRDILGWSEIPARAVKVESIVMGEFDENEVRKDFTPSERVAIAETLVLTMGERRGRPKADNCPELKGSETRDIAAKKAGFGSGKSLERAKAVVDHGAPELVDAMDRGDVSVSAAAVVAKTVPKEEQRRMTPEIVRRAAKATRNRERATPEEQANDDALVERDNIMEAIGFLARLSRARTPAEAVQFLKEFQREELRPDAPHAATFAAEFVKELEKDAKERNRKAA